MIKLAYFRALAEVMISDSIQNNLKRFLLLVMLITFVIIVVTAALLLLSLLITYLPLLKKYGIAIFEHLKSFKTA